MCHPRPIVKSSPKPTPKKPATKSIPQPNINPVAPKITCPATNRTPRLNDWMTTRLPPNVTSGTPADLFNLRLLLSPYFRPDLIVKLALEILSVADAMRVYTGKTPFTGEEVNRWGATGFLALNFILGG